MIFKLNDYVVSKRSGSTWKIIWADDDEFCLQRDPDRGWQCDCKYVKKAYIHRYYRKAT